MLADVNISRFGVPIGDDNLNTFYILLTKVWSATKL